MKRATKYSDGVAERKSLGSLLRLGNLTPAKDIESTVGHGAGVEVGATRGSEVRRRTLGVVVAAAASR